MKEYFNDTWTEPRKQEYVATGASNAFLRQVYMVMSIGLGLTALAAWFVSQKLVAGEWLFILEWQTIIAFSPLIFVLALSFGLEKMSASTASIVFGAFALVMGIGLAPIVLWYTGASIAKTFFITSGTFLAMTVVGLTTNIDLSKFRSILMMALIGLIIASVVNIFLNSGPMDFIISIIGVVLFCALTAYDTQRLLQIGSQADLGTESTQKMVVMGALALYLDFINLFLFLLRIFGSRD